VDVIDVGIQSFPITGDRLMVFNVNTARSRSTHAIDFIELLINSTGDAAPDYRIWVVDEGLLTAGSPSGTLTAVTLDADFNVIDQWGVVAPMNGSTVQFAATAGAMGITGLFEVSVNGSSILADGDPDSTARGFFDPFAPAVSVGAFEPLAAFSQVTIPGTVDAAQVAIQQPLGWLIATLDDAGGIREGDRVPLRQGR
jgi:type V secretory pathway adhesin AidA